MATAVRWLRPDEETAWRAWLRLGWLLNAAIERDLGYDAGLSFADYHVLVQLSESKDHRMRMSDLAAGIAWSRSRVSHQVSRMEARDLVRRTTCPGDARGTFAELRPAGLRAIRRAAPAHVASIRRHFLDRLSPTDLAAITAVARRVLPVLESEHDDTCARVEA